MTRIKLPGPSYTSQSVNADCQRTVNLYPERIESGDGNTDLALYQTPGLKSFVDLTPLPPPVNCTGIENIMVAVSAADFKNSFNAPVEMIPAPGVNRILIPLNAYQQYIFGTVPYTLSSGAGVFGLGSVFSDVVNGLQLFLQVDSSLSVNDYAMVPLQDASPSNALDIAKSINQPLSFANAHDVTADPADGTFIFHIQYLTVDVTTGMVTGGSGHNIYGSKTDLSNAQIAAASGQLPSLGGPPGTPVQLVAAPGADRIIVPLSAVTVSRYTATPMTGATGPFIGFGPTWDDAIQTNNISSTRYNDNTNDTVMDGPLSWSTNNLAASPVNQPLLYGVLTSAAGDSTATVYVQYCIVDLITGHLIPSEQGDVDPAFVPISTVSIDGAFTTAVPLVAAPGANLLNIPVSANVQSIFNTAALNTAASPVIGNGVTAPTIVAQDMMAIADDLTAGVSKVFNTAPSLYKLPSTDVVNGLIQWADANDLSLAAGDTTVNAAIQFVTIDMATGLIVSGCKAVPVPPTPPEPPPPTPEFGLQVARIILSAAQINSAAATEIPITLIPAPGADLMIVPLAYVTQYTFVSVPYSGPASIQPQIGFGSTLQNVFDSATMFIHDHPLRQTHDTIQLENGLSSSTNKPPALWVNSPLIWIDNSEGGSDGTGDGIITLNIVYYVLNVVTGAIVDGHPKRMFCTKTEMSAAAYKNSLTTPVQLVAAPGANKIIIPFSEVMYTHFTATKYSFAAALYGDFGVPPNDTVGLGITTDFLLVDTSAFLLERDSLQQIRCDRLTDGTITDNVPTNFYVNQPFSLRSDNNNAGDPGDTTATIYCPHLVLDVSTGELSEGTGDYFNGIAQLSSAQIKAAKAAGQSLLAAPGADKFFVQVYGVCQSHFNGTAYVAPLSAVPQPHVSPGIPAPSSVNAFISFNVVDAGAVALWETAADSFSLGCAIGMTSDNLPADVVNQPIRWYDDHDVTGATGNTSATVNVGYCILDIVTGALS